MWCRLVLLIVVEVLSSPTPAIVIDRIEGDYAVIEFGTEIVDVPLSVLPPELREGERLVLLRAR